MKQERSPLKHRLLVYSAVTFCALLTVALFAFARSEKECEGNENPLLGQLRGVFQTRNPAIEHVAILDLHAFHYNRAGCVFVGWGIRGDRAFHGDFDDELYGVFVADSGLTRITQVLEIMSTPRWQDYGLYIEYLAADSVVVVGRGLTYGDQPIRRAYAWQRVHPTTPPFVPRALSNSTGDHD